MQRAIFPMKYMRITQSYGVGTHRDSYAVDNAGRSGGIEPILAPFDCVVKKIYTSDANEVWIQSSAPVQYADGSEDYMTILFAHDNDVRDLKIGQTIKQGAAFYHEGTKGKAQGNHVHMECGKGKFSGSGWFKNTAGYWGITNAKKPQQCLWISSETHTMADAGLSWQHTSTKDKPTPAPQLTFAVGDAVTITGAYGSSANGPASFTKAVGQTRLIVKTYPDAQNPYQLGVKAGDASSGNTTGFAPQGALSLSQSTWAAPTPTPIAVGDQVKIIGPYAGASNGEARYTTANGVSRCVTRIVAAAKCPYQLGLKAGDTSGNNTTGFAPKTSVVKK